MNPGLFCCRVNNDSAGIAAKEFLLAFPFMKTLQRYTYHYLQNWVILNLNRNIFIYDLKAHVRAQCRLVNELFISWLAPLSHNSRRKLSKKKHNARLLLCCNLVFFLYHAVFKPKVIDLICTFYVGIDIDAF